MAPYNTRNQAYFGRRPSQQPRNNSGPRPPQGRPQQGHYPQAQLQQPPLEPSPASSAEKDVYFIKGKHGGLIFEACPDEHFVDNVWRVSTHEPFPPARDLTRSVKLNILGTTCCLKLKETLLQNDKSTSFLGYTLIVPAESYEVMRIGYKEQGKVYEILLKLKSPTLHLTSSMLVQSTPMAPHPNPPSYDEKVYLLGWVRRRLLENSKFLRIQVPNARQNSTVIRYHSDIERVLLSAHVSPLANFHPSPPPPAASTPPQAPPVGEDVLPSDHGPTTSAPESLRPVVRFPPSPSPAGPLIQLTEADNHGLEHPIVDSRSCEEQTAIWRARFDTLFGHPVRRHAPTTSTAEPLRPVVRFPPSLLSAVPSQHLVEANSHGIEQSMIGPQTPREVLRAQYNALAGRLRPRHAALMEALGQRVVDLPAGVSDEAIYAWFREMITRRREENEEG